MNRNYGLARVTEPDGVAPAAAWKVDNGSKLGKREARLRISRIHLEWDNFQQICSSCGYDERKIKARISDLVEKRGKLHNPFTKSGGVLSGTVEEISADMPDSFRAAPGDCIYCIAS